MLFKHVAEAKNTEKTEQPGAAPAAEAAMPAVPAKDVSPEALRELIEKNLKWSQIIYEQNRKINSKLLWTAVANWLRLMLMIAVFGAAAWFLPPLVNNLISQYTAIMADPIGAAKNGTVNEFIKNLPLSPEQQNQINNYLKQPKQ